MEFQVSPELLGSEDGSEDEGGGWAGVRCNPIPPSRHYRF